MRVVGTSEEDQKEAFHSLIAHELQHAIANYYRTWVPEQVAEEVPSIDEGLAHLMEDVLGYGQMNFALFAKPYLATAALAPEPVLYDKSLASLSDSARGAAHAIFYYLTSSLGGITYKDGAVDRTSGGSPGLNWIKAYMQAAVGAAGLNAATAGQWMSKVGGFFGALMVDAADSFEAAPEFSVMAPIQGVIDTSGQTGKVFGMRFHAFEGLPQVSESLENLSELQVGQLYKGTLRLYEPEPLLFDVPSGGDVVSIAVSGASTNIGAAVIRIY